MIVRRRFDSCAYCAERCSNAVSLGPTCRRTAPNCWRTCRSFLDSCGGRKNQREKKCSNLWQQRHQLAAWFVCGLIGISAFFSRVWEVRLSKLCRIDRRLTDCGNCRLRAAAPGRLLPVTIGRNRSIADVVARRMQRAQFLYFSASTNAEKAGDACRLFG